MGKGVVVVLADKSDLVILDAEDAQIQTLQEARSRKHANFFEGVGEGLALIFEWMLDNPIKTLLFWIIISNRPTNRN